jgi:hypothetical protein
MDYYSDTYPTAAWKMAILGVIVATIGLVLMLWSDPTPQPTPAPTYSTEFSPQWVDRVVCYEDGSCSDGSTSTIPWDCSRDGNLICGPLHEQ